ncbi:hypothetical protein [Actinomycetospora soli]|uniref:hypothetical protein n=1 Tax=Actinomycetospora soli TaxID=2893887 RepID=UPI001E5F4CA3|nr:hypothetical protein [Actinomycetospora soli]MCD2186866.1 hypothetical protein [Actinomycetospora soli]
MKPRVVAHLVLAALPLLSITAHVGGLVPMHVSAGIVIVPAAVVLVLLAVFRPAPEDRLVLDGLRWGLVATFVYDVFRLDTVALLGWWDDFIPTMGTWLLDVDPSEQVLGGVAGYAWRYAGDGGGLGVVFVTLTAATGLRRLGPRWTVGVAVLFAVGPTWGGLMATVLLPRGQQLMFSLTPVTVTLSFLGHVVFGLVLGLGTWRLRGLEEHWTGPLLVDVAALVGRLSPRGRKASLLSPGGSNDAFLPRREVPRGEVRRGEVPRGEVPGREVPRGEAPKPAGGHTPFPPLAPVRALRPVPASTWDPYAADPLPLEPWLPEPFVDPSPTGEVTVRPWGSDPSSGSPDVFGPGPAVPREGRIRAL